MELFQEKDLTMNTLPIYLMINTHNQQLTLKMKKMRMNPWMISVNKNY